MCICDSCRVALSKSSPALCIGNELTPGCWRSRNVKELTPGCSPEEVETFRKGVGCVGSGPDTEQEHN